MSQAAKTQDGLALDYTPVAAITGGEVLQLADGRAAVIPVDLAASEQGGAQTEGVYKVTKTTTQVWIAGMPIFWDHSANSATCLTPTGDRDFYLGTATVDVASTTLVGYVNLNVKGEYIIDLRKGSWTSEATLGLGVTPLVGGGVQLAFDNTSEAAQAAIISERSFPTASKWILEGRMAIFDIGAAALDIDVGVASGSHATDFQTIANFASVHLDGNALSILVQSDDSDVDVAPQDTTYDAVDDVYFDFVIDGRTLATIKVYINGVLDAGATAKVLTTAAGPLFAIAHMEKTTDTSTADVRIDQLRVRIAEQ